MTIDEAIAQHAKCKAMKLQAEALEKSAREVILAYYKANPDDFTKDPKGERTFVITAEGFCASVTFPQSAEVPAHFDQSHAERFREKLLDIYGEDIARKYFDIVYTLREDRYFEDMKDSEDKTDRALRHELIEPFVIGKVEGHPLTPRISSSENGIK